MVGGGFPRKARGHIRGLSYRRSSCLHECVQYHPHIPQTCPHAWVRCGSGRFPRWLPRSGRVLMMQALCWKILVGRRSVFLKGVLNPALLFELLGVSVGKRIRRFET